MPGARIPDRTLIGTGLHPGQLNKKELVMLDLLYLAIALGFFLLMAVYARAVSKG
ncbi:hypothetical protein MWN33_17975 [Starkeya koreensis]|uniref:Uncharacterized protein n=1 Tax=Ancylobacter koreensis TaxID=266121 RepID=A0ABT0DRL4_9HYPH|nr:hypothetical protein [Ancylobacter koreensis]MCK0209923.1 hypothetical protein [Ancylobacter koreensis]